MYVCMYVCICMHACMHACMYVCNVCIRYSARITTLRVPSSCKRFMIVLSVYAATLNSSQETIMEFYQDLRCVISSIPKADEILILGHFNARARSDSNASGMHFFMHVCLGTMTTHVVSINSDLQMYRHSRHTQH